MTDLRQASHTAESACAALRDAGLACSPGEFELIQREDRWAVLLPEDRIAWFPTSDLGARRLAVERQVLQLVAERCSFQVPRPLSVSARGLEIRRMVPGRCDPWDLFRGCQADPALARAIGRTLGTFLAEQHTRISGADVAGWLPTQVTWPESGDWIRTRLARVVDDAGLVRRMEGALARYEAVVLDARDRVLVHGDVGFHNLATDPQTGAVNGMFDYGSAAFADRHHDFRYLLFDVDREDMLDAAREVYEPAVGRSLDRDRIALYNAACAVSYVAFRDGIAPEQNWCGRTLAEDLRWVRAALARVGH